jgi:hypothetical protein
VGIFNFITGIISVPLPENFVKEGPTLNLELFPLGCLTASLLKPPCGSYINGTVAWIQKWFKISVVTFKKLYIEQFSRRRRRAWAQKRAPNAAGVEMRSF